LSVWYTIDEGQTNFTITQYTDVIDQEAWNEAGNGIVRIRFYAEDKVGNLIHKDVFVIKDVPIHSQPPAIPGSNLIIVILMLFVSITGLILRFVKKKKF
jgi:hypothetical protein